MKWLKKRSRSASPSPRKAKFTEEELHRRAPYIPASYDPPSWLSRVKDPIEDNFNIESPTARLPATSSKEVSFRNPSADIVDDSNNFIAPVPVLRHNYSLNDLSSAPAVESHSKSLNYSGPSSNHEANGVEKFQLRPSVAAHANFQATSASRPTVSSSSLPLIYNTHLEKPQGIPRSYSSLRTPPPLLEEENRFASPESNSFLNNALSASSTPHKKVRVLKESLLASVGEVEDIVKSLIEQEIFENRALGGATYQLPALRSENVDKELNDFMNAAAGESFFPSSLTDERASDDVFLQLNRLLFASNKLKSLIFSCDDVNNFKKQENILLQKELEDMKFWYASNGTLASAGKSVLNHFSTKISQARNLTLKRYHEEFDELNISIETLRHTISDLVEKAFEEGSSLPQLLVSSGPVFNEKPVTEGEDAVGIYYKGKPLLRTEGGSYEAEIEAFGEEEGRIITATPLTRGRQKRRPTVPYRGNLVPLASLGSSASRSYSLQEKRSSLASEGGGTLENIAMRCPPSPPPHFVGRKHSQGFSFIKDLGLYVPHAQSSPQLREDSAGYLPARYPAVDEGYGFRPSFPLPHKPPPRRTSYWKENIERGVVSLFDCCNNVSYAVSPDTVDGGEVSGVAASRSVSPCNLQNLQQMRRGEFLGYLSPVSGGLLPPASNVWRAGEMNEVLNRGASVKSVPGGFSLRSSKEQLVRLEKELDGKWGSFKLFERWLYEAMKWQWLDYKLQRELCARESEIEALKKAYQDEILGLIDGRIKELWYGRVLGLKEVTLKSVKESLDEATGGRSRREKSLERQLLQAEKVIANLMRAETEGKKSNKEMNDEPNEASVSRITSTPYRNQSADNTHIGPEVVPEGERGQEKDTGEMGMQSPPNVCTSGEDLSFNPGIVIPLLSGGGSSPGLKQNEAFSDESSQMNSIGIPGQIPVTYDEINVKEQDDEGVRTLVPIPTITSEKPPVTMHEDLPLSPSTVQHSHTLPSYIPTYREDKSFKELPEESENKSHFLGGLLYFMRTKDDAHTPNKSKPKSQNKSKSKAERRAEEEAEIALLKQLEEFEFAEAAAHEAEAAGENGVFAVEGVRGDSQAAVSGMDKRIISTPVAPEDLVPHQGYDVSPLKSWKEGFSAPSSRDLHDSSALVEEVENIFLDDSEDEDKEEVEGYALKGSNFMSELAEAQLYPVTPREDRVPPTLPVKPAVADEEPKLPSHSYWKIEGEDGVHLPETIPFELCQAGTEGAPTHDRAPSSLVLASSLAEEPLYPFLPSNNKRQVEEDKSLKQEGRVRLGVQGGDSFPIHTHDARPIGGLHAEKSDDRHLLKPQEEPSSELKGNAKASFLQEEEVALSPSLSGVQADGLALAAEIIKEPPQPGKSSLESLPIRQVAEESGRKYLEGPLDFLDDMLPPISSGYADKPSEGFSAAKESSKLDDRLIMSAASHTIVPLQVASVGEKSHRHDASSMEIFPLSYTNFEHPQSLPLLLPSGEPLSHTVGVHTSLTEETSKLASPLKPQMPLSSQTQAPAEVLTPRIKHALADLDLFEDSLRAEEGFISSPSSRYSPSKRRALVEDSALLWHDGDSSRKSAVTDPLALAKLADRPETSSSAYAYDDFPVKKRVADFMAPSRQHHLSLLEESSNADVSTQNTAASAEFGAFVPLKKARIPERGHGEEGGGGRGGVGKKAEEVERAEDVEDAEEAERAGEIKRPEAVEVAGSPGLTAYALIKSAQESSGLQASLEKALRSKHTTAPAHTDNSQTPPQVKKRASSCDLSINQGLLAASSNMEVYEVLEEASSRPHQLQSSDLHTRGVKKIFHSVELPEEATSYHLSSRNSEGYSSPGKLLQSSMDVSGRVEPASAAWELADNVVEEGFMTITSRGVVAGGVEPPSLGEGAVSLVGMDLPKYIEAREAASEELADVTMPSERNYDTEPRDLGVYVPPPPVGVDSTPAQPAREVALTDYAPHCKAPRGSDWLTAAALIRSRGDMVWDAKAAGGGRGRMNGDAVLGEGDAIDNTPKASAAIHITGVNQADAKTPLQPLQHFSEYASPALSTGAASMISTIALPPSVSVPPPATLSSPPSTSLPPSAFVTPTIPPHPAAVPTTVVDLPPAVDIPPSVAIPSAAIPQPAAILPTAAPHPAVPPPPEGILPAITPPAAPPPFTTATHLPTSLPSPTTIPTPTALEKMLLVTSQPHPSLASIGEETSRASTPKASFSRHPLSKEPLASHHLRSLEDSLRFLDIFKDFDEVGLVDIADSMKNGQVQLPKNCPFIEKGDRVDALFFLLRGSMIMINEEDPLHNGKLIHGFLLVEEFCADLPSPFSVYTVKPSSLYKLTKRTYESKRHDAIIRRNNFFFACLLSVPLLESLKDIHEALLELAEWRRFKDGEVIIEGDSVGSSLIALIEGNAVEEVPKVVEKRPTVYLPGDCIGHLSLLNDEPFTFPIKASSRQGCTVGIVTRKRFEFAFGPLSALLEHFSLFEEKPQAPQSTSSPNAKHGSRSGGRSLLRFMSGGHKKSKH